MLYQYVDFFPYCDELSEITGVSIDVIIMIVSQAFKKISEGVIDSATGFEEIEEELAKEACLLNVVPASETNMAIRKQVC